MSWLWEIWSNRKRVNDIEVEVARDNLYFDAKEYHKWRRRGKETIRFSKFTLEELKDIRQDIQHTRERILENLESLNSKSFREIEKEGIIERFLRYLEKDVRDYLVVKSYSKNKSSKDKKYLEYLKKNARSKNLRKEAKKALRPNLLLRFLRAFFR